MSYVYKQCTCNPQIKYHDIPISTFLTWKLFANPLKNTVHNDLQFTIIRHRFFIHFSFQIHRPNRSKITENPVLSAYYLVVTLLDVSRGLQEAFKRSLRSLPDFRECPRKSFWLPKPLPKSSENQRKSRFVCLIPRCDANWRFKRLARRPIQHFLHANDSHS